MSPHVRPRGALGVVAVGAGVLVSGAALVAPESAALPEIVRLAQQHAPAPRPDRTVTTLTGDPSTTRSVAWRTDDSVPRGAAQLAGPALASGGVGPRATVAATTTPLTANLGYTSHYHRADFSGLRPSTRYDYRVGDPRTGRWSAWTSFATADAAPTDFRFLFLGDAQDDLAGEWAEVAQRAYRDGAGAALLVQTGDLVDVGNRDEEWGERAEATTPQAASVPTLVVPGNHEYFRLDGSRSLSEHWRLQFPLPDNGPAGEEGFAGTVYSVDYQGVRFIGLNSAYREAHEGDPARQRAFVDAQAAWLEEQLADNPNRWTVAFFHHPVYSTATARDNQLSRDAWRPLLEGYGVDLVLSGHDHTYGRGYTGTARDRGRITGPVYVTSVSGPKSYDASPAGWVGNGAVAQRLGQDVALYQLVGVSDRALRVVSRTAAGQFFDGFEVVKGEGDGAGRRVVELDADDP